MISAKSVTPLCDRHHTCPSSFSPTRIVRPPSLFGETVQMAEETMALTARIGRHAHQGAPRCQNLTGERTVIDLLNRLAGS
jgi:hypothetical protein